MFKGIIIFVAIALLGFFAVGCSVTRHIPQGQYLVQKIRIIDDKSVDKRERITAAELDKYVRQSPNKRFLGTNFYVWLYEQADPKRENRWNNWKRKIGEAPVLLEMDMAHKTARNFKVYMDSRGFRSSSSSFEVDTTTRKKRAQITYRTHQGPAYRIDTITYDFRDKFLEQILLPDTVNTLLHKGEIFDISQLERERERITSFLKQRGYFNFSVNNITFSADTLQSNHRVGLKMIFNQHLAGYNARGEAIMNNNTVYRIDQINIYPDYDPMAVRSDSTQISRLDTLYFRGLNVIFEKKSNIRPAILRQALPLYPNYVYNSAQISRAYSDLMSMGYFRSAKIAFVERPQDVEQTNFVTYIGQSADSVATNYTREGYLQCNILCTPALKQSFKAELEGSTTSSFYGLKATVGYQNRNIFRGAEALDISFTVGYEFMKAPDAKKKRATEFGITTGLLFPRFLLPWRTMRFRSVNQPKTKVELSVNYQDRPYYRRVLSSAGITYQWTNDKYSSFSLKPIDINVVDVSRLDTVDFFSGTSNKYLRESFKTQFIGGLSFGYVYNNQRKHMGRNATNIRFNFEMVGNLISGVEHLFWKNPSGTIFGLPYAQYLRTDLNVSRKIMLGEVTALVGRIYGGVAVAYGNSEAIPFDRQFYAGGSNGMRGWTPRTLGPGSVPNPHNRFPVQTGDMKLEANLELRFPIWGMVHGATFLDAGNVWFIRQSSEYSDQAVFKFNNFYRQLGFNTGIGLRLDIKFVILRLDWGIQLHNPNNPVGKEWIGGFKWKDTALNFGVGYPF